VFTATRLSLPAFKYVPFFSIGAEDTFDEIFKKASRL